MLHLLAVCLLLIKLKIETRKSTLRLHGFSLFLAALPPATRRLPSYLPCLLACSPDSPRNVGEMQLKWRSPYEKYVKSTDCFPHPPLTSTSPSLSLSSAQHLQLVFDGRNVLNVGHALERGQRKKLSTHTHTEPSKYELSLCCGAQYGYGTHTHTQWQTSLDLPPVLDFVLPRFCHLVNLQSACKAYAAYAQCAPKQRTTV